MSKSPKAKQPEYNHWDEFVKFVKAQAILSKEFREQLILKMGGGMQDAHERGILEGKRRAKLELERKTK
jgi:hypothetical protein